MKIVHPLTPLRQRMLEDLQIRNYSPHTVDAYLRAVAQFAKHFRTAPDRLGAEHIRTYQLHLLHQQVSESVFIQTVCALRFFYETTLLLEPFGITRYYTDYWGAYTRHLEADEHQPGKHNTQQIERKHLTLRIRIKRLVRKTICFSRSIQMHNIVLGLFINRYEFGLRV